VVEDEIQMKNKNELEKYEDEKKVLEMSKS